MLSGWPNLHRPRLPTGTLPSALLVLLLILCIANSTVAAAWVPGSDVVTPLALTAAFCLGVVALVPAVPVPVALILGVIAAPLAAFVSAHQALYRAHPGDPTDPVGLFQAWLRRLADGEAATDVSLYLYLICCLAWVVSGWLSWCVFRWRRPLLGLAPGAVALATNVLNYPEGQQGYVLVFLVLTFGLLLWTNYMRSVQSAVRRRLRLSADARWDFWESGVVVLAATVAIGIFLPPLSTADRTVEIQNAGFQEWAQLQQRLDHPVALGNGPAGPYSVGLSRLAALLGAQRKPSGVVFSYTVQGTYGPPPYFRVFDLDTTSTGPGGPVWRYTLANTTQARVRKGVPLDYAEAFQDERTATFKISMLRPPGVQPNVLPYPGRLERVDQNAVAHMTAVNQSPPGTSGHRLDTIDDLTLANHGSSAGTYTVTVAYSVATVGQLETAGTAYPSWVQPYRTFGPSYRSPATMQRIRDLALKVTAGQNNPYDQAQAIETYLRSNFRYTLTPLQPPAGTDPIEYFLFTSKEGYCEYFATAMGDMLRSLGIPTRLVNGYGPGTFDEQSGSYLVRESDVHTWVEVYFPNYGWIPFEPTPDGTYFPIPRGVPSATCSRDSAGCEATAESGAGSRPVVNRPGRFVWDVGPIQAGEGGGEVGSVTNLLPIVLAGLALLVLGAWLAMMRYLRPRTASGVWRRLRMLATLAGVRPQPHETPIEFGLRLGQAIPEAATSARELAERYAIVAYGPHRVATAVQPAVLAAWADLCPILLRHVSPRNRVKPG
jgi:transglutaminase-like putative cysteine protease